MRPVDAVLAELAELTSPGTTWVPFAPIASATGLTTFQVRRACRLLARRGFASYSNGLWSDDGLPVGAGYGITAEGMAAWIASHGGAE